MPVERLPDARAAARFHQIAAIEREVIEQVKAIADCRAHLKELTTAYDGLIEALRKAARDEGELPLMRLFDLEPVTTPAAAPDGGGLLQ